MIQNQPLMPPALQKGDKVVFVTPSGCVDSKWVHLATHVLETWGLVCETSPHALNRLGRFCGTIDQRLSDLQTALDDPETKAIFCTRGGFGVVHLLENIQLSGIRQNPKWVVGYSDITAMHLALFQQNIVSLHASMAKHIAQEPDGEATLHLRNLLFGKPMSYQLPPHPLNIDGCAEGRLIGGNFAVFCGLMGSRFAEVPEGSILFIEDIGEPPYRIDRMMWQLKLSGIIDRISALIVGQFTDCNPDPLMYAPVYESIHNILKNKNIPVCFDFPVGHVSRNFPLLHGAKISLKIDDGGTAINNFFRS